jgi:CarD family transcriptional regulator
MGESYKFIANSSEGMAMYNKGDRILYPLYGAGVIECLEYKDVDGAIQLYYVLNIPVGNLTIKISAAKAEDLGVRPVHHKDTVLSELSGIVDIHVNMPDNWNLRYKENMDRIKSGKMPQVAIVFRSLLFRERERGLSTAEKKMMTTAKQILLSELILSLDIERTEAEDILNDAFNK